MAVAARFAVESLAVAARLVFGACFAVDARFAVGARFAVARFAVEPFVVERFAAAPRFTGVSVFVVPSPVFFVAITLPLAQISAAHGQKP